MELSAAISATNAGLWNVGMGSPSMIFSRTCVMCSKLFMVLLSENVTGELQGAAAAHAQAVQGLFDKAAAGVLVLELLDKVK